MTSTASPTAAGVLVNTKIPEEAAGREASGVGCWIQKPRLLPWDRTAVTIPATRSTTLPRSGERNPLPWMSWMVFGPGWQAGSLGVTAQSTAGVTVTGGALGVGAARAKSVALLPAFVNGLMVRCAEAVAVVVAVGPVPAKSLAVP